MAHISGHGRSQTLLFPESVNDYVGPDNPVRFIDAFVDGLDLASAGVDAKPTGRPGYAPADLLKLYIYMKGLENVRAEFSLTALAYNMRCVINILGAKGHDRSRPNVKAGAFPARNSTGTTLNASAMMLGRPGSWAPSLALTLTSPALSRRS